MGDREVETARELESYVTFDKLKFTFEYDGDEVISTLSGGYYSTKITVRAGTN